MFHRNRARVNNAAGLVEGRERALGRLMPLIDPTSVIAKAPVIPVLTVDRAADAAPLARALVAGGLPVIEVTLRTRAALDAVHAIAAEVPECVVGVGTVTRNADIPAALSAGAKYLVSPGTPPALAVALAEAPVPVVPGCATVTEAMALIERGFTVLKFFPAEQSGGVAWLKAVAAPLPGIKFCPTGGIDMRNAGAYLALPNVISVGGSWPAPRELIAAHDFAGITALARQASDIRNQVSAT